ncbi:hypothetical protein FH972_015444 [Carpinus fangiana]|uniref:RNase H type-1 domain-containing protein n=1 Tax=Carpinus fangiana TaxID=176857 RepID=A0A5N6RDD5_9ROSI|nr:hypothetical protein FH972_015444 [Carpinus fangiana]
MHPALEVVTLLNRDEAWLGSYGQIIQDAQQVLQYCMEWKATHVPRAGNGVAHSLAKMALSVGQEVIWQDDFPLSMEGTSNKRSWSQKHYSNTFKTKKVKTLYANRFKQRAVLAERVTCDKRGLRGSSARRPCLKGHPISTEISYLMPSDCSSSGSHSPTRTNPSRQTLLSRPRTRSSKVKKSLEPSPSTSTHVSAKSGDGDISTRLSSNIRIAKARKDLSDHIKAKARKRKREREVEDLALCSTCSTCTSAHPFDQCMNLINELIQADKISNATYIKAISVFVSRQKLRWDFVRMSSDNRRSWLSQLLP